MSGNEQLLELYYFQVTDIWQKFCEFHNELYDLTCREYEYLLSGNVEELDLLVQEKQIYIDKISILDDIRRDLIENINRSLNNTQRVQNITDLVLMMNNFGEKRGHSYLIKFNELLIEIIGKIKDQNKKNQIFLNKACDSLKKLREDVIGEKTYSSYNSRGKTT